eukprot:gene182-4428_t
MTSESSSNTSSSDLNFEKKSGSFEREGILRSYSSVKSQQNTRIRDFENMVCGTLKVQQKSLFNKWKTYYFELYQNILYKFSKEGDERPIDGWNLSDFSVIDFDSISGKKNTFGIFFKGEEQIILMSNSKEEKDRWKEKIESLETKNNNITQNSVLDSLLDAAISTDKYGIVLSLNEKAIKLFGYQKDEIIGKNVKILMNSGVASLHDGFMKKYLATGKQSLIGVERKMIVKHKNGTNFTIIISLGEISMKGSNIRFIATFRRNEEEEEERINQDEKHQIIIESNFKDPLITLNLTQDKLNLKLNEMKSKFKDILNENFNELKLQINNLNQQEDIMLRDIKYLNERILIEKETINNIEEELSFYRNDDDHDDIKKLLNNEIGYEALLEFSNEDIQNYIKFYKEADHFKMMDFSSMDILKIESQKLFEKYLDSNKIKISNNLFNFIKDNLTTPTKNLFISVQSEVLNKLKNGPYQKFENSGIGKAILKTL